jgi:hypothetical protein
LKIKVQKRAYRRENREAHDAVFLQAKRQRYLFTGGKFARGPKLEASSLPIMFLPLGLAR